MVVSCVIAILACVRHEAIAGLFWSIVVRFSYHSFYLMYEVFLFKKLFNVQSKATVVGTMIEYKWHITQSIKSLDHSGPFNMGV